MIVCFLEIFTRVKTSTCPKPSKKRRWKIWFRWSTKGWVICFSCQFFRSI